MSTQSQKIKLPKVLIVNALVGVTLAISTCFLAFFYASGRLEEMKNAETAVLISKGPVDVVVLLLVVFSLYTAAHMLISVVARRRALLASDPKLESLKLERSGSFFRQYWITMLDAAGRSGKSRTYRVTPRSRTAANRFQGATVKADIYYGSGNLPLAVSLADEIAFTELNWNTRGLVERCSLKESLLKAGIVMATLIFLCASTFIFARDDLRWMSAMRSLDPRTARATNSLNGIDPADGEKRETENVEAQIENLIEVSRSLSPSDIRRTYGLITSAAERARMNDFEGANSVLDMAVLDAKDAREPDIHLAMLATAAGSIAKVRGDFKEAVEKYQEGEENWRKVKEKGIVAINARVVGFWEVPLLNVDSQLSEVVYRLAIMLDESGKIDQAETEYLRYIEGAKNVSANSFGYFTSLLALENFYTRHRLEDKAVEQRLYILKEIQKKFGKDQEQLARQLERYGGIASGYGQQDCAIVLLRRAEMLRRDLYKSEKTASTAAHLAQALCLLADAYKRAGKYGEAKPLYSEAIDLFKQDESSDLWTWPELELAHIGVLSGESKSSLPRIENVLNLRLRNNAASDEKNARPLHLLANNYRDRSQKQRAEQMYRGALAILEGKRSDRNIELMELRLDYAKFLAANGKKSEAEKLVKQVEKTRQSPGW